MDYKLTDEERKYLIEQINTKKIISYNDIKPGIILFNNIPKDDNENKIKKRNKIIENEKYENITSCTILTTYSRDTP